MKVVNVCLGGVVTDGWNYQDNILPKYHKINGAETVIITSNFIWSDKGTIIKDERQEYFNENNIKVIRLKCNSDKMNSRFKKYYGLFEALEKEKPDIIFMHGCQLVDAKVIVKYMKNHKDVILYVDNHADFSNSATNWISKNVLHKIVWKHYAKLLEPYTKKFYGVLPARVDFLVNVYGLSKEKVELLVMGADDEKIEEAKSTEIRKQIREKYGIADDDFLIMTGGKIDLFKTQTLLLMEAVNKMENPKVKLIVFGSVVPELKEKITSLCSERVQYIGWVQAIESYKYFASCDLAVFPGRHSVFWEQVAGQGVPMVVKYWDGTTHIDMDGNVKFLYKDSTDEIIEVLNETFVDIKQMKTVAEEKANKFKYSDIAKKSIEWQE